MTPGGAVYADTGWHHGKGFLQWTGSAARRDVLDRVARVSTAVRSRTADEAALWRLLRAETSCNFYLGEAWVPRCHADLDAAERALTARPPDAAEPVLNR